MLNSLKYFAFFLTVVLITTCNHKPKITELKKTSDTTSVVTPVNSVTDDLASFIAGIPDKKNGCLSRLDSTEIWKHYASDLDSMFNRDNSLRINKMKAWADTELIKIPGIKTVFYPFGGPDFLNAHIFYPDVDQYILIGLEPVGYLPDICNMIPDSVASYLNAINSSLKDIFKRSYFITKAMDKDLRKTKVNGTVPLISLFIKRTGHQIVSIQRLIVDSSGKLKSTDSFKNTKDVVPGIRIDFQEESNKKEQSVLYFRTDISDKGFVKNNGFRKFLSGLPDSYTYLKAASYLMHFKEFKIIRSQIFDLSSTILQDDSGIAYKFFDKSKWDIKLYGKYFKPKDEFAYISEPDLEEAYKHTAFRPIPYSVGYNWRANHSNLLYAIKK